MRRCVLDEQQLKTVMRYVEIGQAEGAKLATGGIAWRPGGMRAAGSMSRPSSLTAIRRCVCARKDLRAGRLRDSV